MRLRFLTFSINPEGKWNPNGYDSQFQISWYATTFHLGGIVSIHQITNYIVAYFIAIDCRLDYRAMK